MPASWPYNEASPPKAGCYTGSRTTCVNFSLCTKYRLVFLETLCTLLHISCLSETQLASQFPNHVLHSQIRVNMTQQKSAEQTFGGLRQHLLQSSPGTRLIAPSDPEFESTRLCFIRRDDAVPLAVARPQTAEDVCTLVRYCVDRGVDFVVRAGGHDCSGRSQVRNALSIDIRDIAHVHISEDRQTARVGGGIVLRDLAKALDAQGLITPV